MTWQIDCAERAVTLGDEPVRLTAIEYRMLVELSVNAGRVLTYDHLLRKVWGLGIMVTCGLCAQS